LWGKQGWLCAACKNGNINNLNKVVNMASVQSWGWRGALGAGARVWLVVLGIAWLPSAAWAERWVGKVVGVADGDTITVIDKENKIKNKICNENQHIWWIQACCAPDTILIVVRRKTLLFHDVVTTKNSGLLI
jgi:hypothetical protein